MSEECKFIQVSFTGKTLKKHPSRDADKGRSAVRDYMTSHGFEEKDCSSPMERYYSYTSKEEMTFEEAGDILAPLLEENPWLLKQAANILVMEVGETVSLLDQIRKASEGAQEE